LKNAQGEAPLQKIGDEESCVILTLVGCVVGSFIGRGNIPKKEREKWIQRVGPLRIESADIGTVLQRVVDSAEVPVYIDVCAILLSEKVILKTEQPMSVEKLLEGNLSME